MDTNPAAPTLLVLAAGLGSRYGGLKQLDPVGPGGATLLDYSIHDAMRAGFGDVVFVIRPDMKEQFAAFAAERYGDRIRIGTAFQDSEGLPAGRTRPWGTAHAVLSASTAVSGPFVVVNADDFYGAPAFEAMARFLRDDAADSIWSVVGYKLGDTIGAGGVNRAVCHVEDGWLRAIEEVTGITAIPGGRFEGNGRGQRVELGADTPVSMNMWGFTPDVFGKLAGGFNDFLMRRDVTSAEYLIPDAIQLAIDERTARVKVLETGGRWFGMTHREEKGQVTAELEILVKQGAYPERLW